MCHQKSHHSSPSQVCCLAYRCSWIIVLSSHFSDRMVAQKQCALQSGEPTLPVLNLGLFLHRWSAVGRVPVMPAALQSLGGWSATRPQGQQGPRWPELCCWEFRCVRCSFHLADILNLWWLIGMCLPSPSVILSPHLKSFSSASLTLSAAAVLCF